jgi:hypothetical protein
MLEILRFERTAPPPQCLMLEILFCIFRTLLVLSRPSQVSQRIWIGVASPATPPSTALYTCASPAECLWLDGSDWIPGTYASVASVLASNDHGMIRLAILFVISGLCSG